MVHNVPSVGIVRCSKNLVDAREKTSIRARNPLVWLAPDGERGEEGRGRTGIDFYPDSAEAGSGGGYLAFVRWSFRLSLSQRQNLSTCRVDGAQELERN